MSNKSLSNMNPHPPVGAQSLCQSSQVLSVMVPAGGSHNNHVIRGLLPECKLAKDWILGDCSKRCFEVCAIAKGSARSSLDRCVISITAHVEWVYLRGMEDIFLVSLVASLHIGLA